MDSNSWSVHVVRYVQQAVFSSLLALTRALLATLLAMLITWLATGRPHYGKVYPVCIKMSTLLTKLVSMEGNVPYISDIGADILKPLFIVGCSITAVSFFLTLFIERYLRHSGR